ncbi:MFS transporter [Chloroflexota bacterium]
MANKWGGGTSTFFAYTHGSHDICPALLAPLLPLIRAELGLTYFQSGILLSAYTITVGLSQFLGGWLGDRYNRWAVIAIGLAGVGSATIAFGFSSAYHQMLILLVTMGIFAGAYHPSAIPLLYSHSQAKTGGKVLGLHHVGGSAGYALAPIIGGLIVDLSNWKMAFIILGIPALIAMFLVIRKFTNEKAIGSATGITSSSSSSSTTEAIEKRISTFQALKPVAVILIMTVLSQFVVGTTMAFFPIYLVDKYGIAAVSAALLIGLLRSGGIAGSLFGGWLSDRWTRINAVILALVVTGPFLYLIIMIPFNAFFIVAMVVFGIVALMRQSTVQPYLMENTPPYLRATMMGIFFGLGQEGTSLMQPLAGYYMDIFGIVPVFNFIALIGLILSVALLLIIFISRKFKPNNINLR